MRAASNPTTIKDDYHLYESQASPPGIDQTTSDFHRPAPLIEILTPMDLVLLVRVTILPPSSNWTIRLAYAINLQGPGMFGAEIESANLQDEPPSKDICSILISPIM